MKITIFLLAAQQGLTVAAKLLRVAASQNREKAKSPILDPNLAAKLSHSAESEDKLATILESCDAGITDYLSHSD